MSHAGVARTRRPASEAWAWALLIPSLLLVAGIILYPLLLGISLSLHRVILTRPDLGRPFVGWRNFARMAADPVLWQALSNTVRYVGVGVLSQFALGLAAALLLNRRRRFIWLARVVVMLPWFLPPVAAAYMFAFMIDPRFGIVTHAARLIGIDLGGQGILANPDLALWGVLLVELWRSYPFFALFLLAGLQAIPPELREASALDGASRWQHFTQVVWPLLRPVVLAATLLEAIRMINSPTLLLLLTGGGPGNATQVLSLYAFQTAYSRFDFGYGAAICVALLVVVAGASWTYLRVAGSRLT